MSKFENISVHDKERPTLGATKEAQDVSNTPRNVVPMPQFTDPGNPDAASGSINMSLDTHPVEHAKDYAGAIVDTTGTQAVYTGADDGVSGKAPDAEDENENDRSKWLKPQWQELAKKYGLAHSGTVAEITSDVDEFEKAVKDATEYDLNDWQKEIDGAADADHLALLRRVYDNTGVDNADVVGAFDAKTAEFASNSNQ